MDLNQALDIFKNYLKKEIFFDPSAFEESKNKFALKLYSKGEYFVEEGHICKNFGFIVEGIFRAYYNQNGNDITTCFCNENTFATSTSSFISQSPSPISVQAIENSYVLITDYIILNELYNKSPFWLAFGRVIAEKEYLYADCMHRCYGQMEAEDKYKMFLKDNPGIANRVPLQQIASFLGIRPETLSRIRKKTARS